jgi:hypothetical protein
MSDASYRVLPACNPLKNSQCSVQCGRHFRIDEAKGCMLHGILYAMKMTKTVDHRASGMRMGDEKDNTYSRM